MFDQGGASWDQSETSRITVRLAILYILMYSVCIDAPFHHKSNVSVKQFDVF